MAKKPLAAPVVSERELDALRERLAESGRIVGVTPDVTTPTISGRRRLSTAELRARRQKRSDVGEGTMTLVLDADGVLRWHEGSAAVHATRAPNRSATPRAGRRAGRRGVPFAGEVVDQYTFDRLGVSDVNRFLSDWDERLTPRQGLWIWKEGALAPFALDGNRPKRTLLLVHGTFSNCQSFGGSLEAVVDTDRKSFLTWARGKYDLILAFNHATLSVSPLLNALRLESLLGDTPGTIDIVCHSRGGLVARWWHELVCSRPDRRGKVVFVGSPLAGTSLAAPDKIRSAIDYLTNVGRVIGAVAGLASTLVPFLSVAQGLMSLFCSATSVLSSTPVADVFIGLVPGLTSQSRVENNFEMVELRRRAKLVPDYYAIASDFRPTDPGWFFWRHFTKLGAASHAASLIFPRSHDLVVDHEAMTELGQGVAIADLRSGAGRQRLLDLGRNDKVHHVNYFEDPRVVQFLKKSLS